MSENARRDREQALAALESSPRVEEQSIVAPQPQQPPPAQPPRVPSAGAVATGGGVLAALVAVDQALQQHGTTLADLTVKAGPVFGGLVANGWVVAIGLWALYALWRRQHEEREERKADREWARHRAAAQDSHARAQVRAIRAVADEIVAVRGDLAAQAMAHRDLTGRVDAVEREVRHLREQLPESRRTRRADN